MTITSSPQMTGLRDAHLHIAEYGEELTCVDLSGARSREECLTLLARAASERDPASTRWIKGVGARNNAWADPAWPDAIAIDDAVGGAPAFVLSFDHHALVAGAAVLRLMGIDAGTPDPPGGVIEKRDGRCTGLLLESACWAARVAAPAPSEQEARVHVRAALRELRARGIVEAHDMLARPFLARELLRLERAGELDVSVTLYAMHEHFHPVLDVCRAGGSERVRFGGLKIFTDGTLSSRTAHMLHDFVDPLPGLPRGKAMMTQAEIEDALREADGAGFPVAAHAIGDAAVRAVLDTIERVAPAAQGQRIEHAQFVDEADVPRFAALGVIASTQPCHLLTDIHTIRAYVPARQGRAFPLRELMDAAEASGRGARDLVWLGSDAPIVPPDPMDNVQAAVERRCAGMDAREALAIAQAVSREQALACMTSRLLET